MLFNLFQPIMLCWVHIFDITPNHLPFRGGLLERERERGNNRIRAQHFFSTQHKTRHVVRLVENPSHTTSGKSIWGLYNRFRCQLNSQKYPPDHRTHSLGSMLDEWEVHLLVLNEMTLNHSTMVERYPNLKEEVAGSNLDRETSSLLDRNNLPSGQPPHVLWVRLST